MGYGPSKIVKLILDHDEQMFKLFYVSIQEVKCNNVILYRDSIFSNKIYGFWNEYLY